MSEYRMGTKCVQAGYEPGNGEPRQIPIIQSTTFKYSTSEDMGKLFDLEAEGYFYSRLQNPTNDLVANKNCKEWKVEQPQCLHHQARLTNFLQCSIYVRQEITLLHRHQYMGNI